MRIKLIAIATVMTLTALAQQPAFLNTSIAWDPSPSPNVSVYIATLTTNKLAMGTNGYAPPASAVIAVTNTATTQITLTNLWPNITNGVFSVFVQARDAAGVDSLTSSNLVFRMIIPPLPPRNLRLVP